MLDSLKGGFVMFGSCVAMALKNILHNRMRSFLTILGILIGVTAVITLITTVSGVSGTLSGAFSSMGAGTLSVRISGSDLKSGLTSEELDELTELACVDGITPSVTLSCRVSRGASHDTGMSVVGKNAYAFRTDPELVARGRALNAVDETNMSYVCLIGSEMVEDYFYGVDPIEETLYIDGLPFLVVGIFDEATASTDIWSMMSGSADILIPYTTALRMNNTTLVTSFTVTLAEGTDSDTASDELSEKLDALFSFEEDCYTVSAMSGIEDTMDELLGMMSALLAGIASIALIVGGIGIMNMMLTTVSERTVEIGLKKALGAVPQQIRLQFLIESFTLSVTGGLMGAVLGVVLSAILCNVLGTSFVLNWGAIWLGVGFSACVGILFGWMPAVRASKLNPIDALRSA